MKTYCIILLAACASLASAQQRNVTSILEVLDVTNGNRTVVKEFPYRIEAPNWTSDGQWLVYNSGGKLYKLSPDSPGEPEMINTGFAARCNNDHVIAADGSQIAISNGTKEDGKSRVYTLPIQGGTPRPPNSFCIPERKSATIISPSIKESPRKATRTGRFNSRLFFKAAKNRCKPICPRE